MSAGGGRPLPLWGSGGVIPGKFLKTQMLKSCILVASALISGLPRTCISEQSTSMSRAKSVPKFQLFSPVVAPLEPKTNQLEIMTHVNCMQDVKKLRDQYIVGLPPPKSWGTSLPGPHGCCAYAYLCQGRRLAKFLLLSTHPP